jgi:hypothetical protein
MDSIPTLTLCIPVYKGGKYWEECWKSVAPLAHYFDSILVSFNKSELQMKDVSVLLENKPGNVRYLIQPEFLEPLDHYAAHVDYLDTDYVFFLCHDDCLLEPGLKEMQMFLRTASGKKIAIFGSQEWSESEETYPGITRELRAFPSGITVNDFVLMDLDKNISFSLSGSVCPVKGLQKIKSMDKLFLKGIRHDNFMITYPGIERIFQTRCPSVRIQLHPGQEGRQNYSKERKFDNMTYFFIQGLHGSNDVFIYRNLKQIIHYLSMNPKKGSITHFLRLIKESRHWNITPSQYFRVSLLFYKCAMDAVCQRTANGIKKIVRVE